MLRMGSSRGCRTEGAVVNGYIHSVNGDPVVLNSADSVNRGVVLLHVGEVCSAGAAG